MLAHDVSDRKQLERRLAEAEKMEAIGRLAGGVAHDFNNLLTVIGGYAEILLQRTAGRDRDDVGEIARAAGQAAELTRQLLAFSRRQVLHPKVLDLNGIVADMETMLHRIIGDDISVGVRLAPGLAPVEADRAQIERVILNLAVNARDAMPGGGALTVETANVDLDEQQVAQHGDGRSGPHVLLAVSDTGVGHGRRRAPPPVRAVLHHQDRRHRPRPGHGVRHRQAERRRHLRLQRARPRHDVQGLPAGLPASRTTDAAPAGEPAAERGSETIMVVEDDAGVRDLVRLMLEANGYEVLAVEDAEEAARLCTERAGVDLLLTDVVMPGLNGRALAERLGEIAPTMRILFMSGYSDEAVHRHGVLGESAAFLEKPFTERALTRKVREVLDDRLKRGLSPFMFGGRASSAGAGRRRAARDPRRAPRAVGRARRVGVEPGLRSAASGAGVRRRRPRCWSVAASPNTSAGGPIRPSGARCSGAM